MTKKTPIVKPYKVVCMINLACTGATKKRRDELTKILRPLCDEKKDVYITYQKSLPDDCQEIAKRRPDVLIIAGGDGTFVVTPKFLRQAYGSNPLPKLYFFEMGQENKLGAELRDSFGPVAYLTDKIYSSRFKRLENLIDLIKQKADLKTKAIKLIKVNNTYYYLDKEKGRRRIRETFYTFDIAYDGLVTAILEDYYGIDEKKSELNLRDDFFLSFIKPGFRDVARVLLKTIFQQPFNATLGLPQTYFNTYTGTLIIDGKKEPAEKFIGLYASTIRSLAVGARPFHKTNGEVMHLRGGYIQPWKLLLHFNDIYSGNDIVEEGWIDKTATKIMLNIQMMNFRTNRTFIFCHSKTPHTLITKRKVYKINYKQISLTLILSQLK